MHTNFRFARHSRENGNPESFATSTPASAGVTTLSSPADRRGSTLLGEPLKYYA